jgi:prepilin-type N-terminal cleavage/methylation domain-containing protein
MQKAFSSGVSRRNKFLLSFTLIELLTVIAIIALLAALVLYAGSGVMAKAARSRAASEIQAMSTALDSYKTDNGLLPPATVLLTTTYISSDPSVGGSVYQQSSQILYQALSGQTNYNDPHKVGVKTYLSFRVNQLGNATAAAGTSPGSASTYIKDPWGFSYGYSTGDANVPQTTPPYSGTGFCDLWTTAGLVGGSSGPETNTAAWIGNWQ